MSDFEDNETVPLQIDFQVKQPGGNYLTIIGGTNWVGIWTDEESRKKGIGFHPNKIDTVIRILEKIKRECCPPDA